MKKIAVATYEGAGLAQHLGHCTQFAVFTVDPAERRVFGREDRTNPGLGPGPDGLEFEGLTKALADCDALLCQGLGSGAAGALIGAGVQVLVTSRCELRPEEAVHRLLAGELPLERIPSCCGAARLRQQAANEQPA